MTNTFTLAVAVIGGFTATTLGFASAATAAPSGVGNAQDTINALQSQGFNVILNGAAVYPLSGCKVTGIEDSTAPTSTHQDAGSTQNSSTPSTSTFHAGVDNRSHPGIENAVMASAFRDRFGEDYGITIVDGPMAGLLARAVVVIGADGNVAYTELVPEIGVELSYDAGLSALGSSV
jgi:hypothetical protein